jgi:hypothetical protein
VTEGRNHQKYKDDGSFTTVAAATSEDIAKVLKPTEYPSIEALRRKLHPELNDMIPLFNKREAEKLAPHREGIDHKVNIKKQSDGTSFALPWGPLYSMSKEELLVLRKSLDDLLKRGISDLAHQKQRPPCFLCGNLVEGFGSAATTEP